MANYNNEKGLALYSSKGHQKTREAGGEETPENYFDLVFIDIQMPNKNGYEAAKEIRASAREDLKIIPIVAMSADAFSDDIQRALSVGMNDHVAKPIELSKLSAVIEKWVK